MPSNIVMHQSEHSDFQSSTILPFAVGFYFAFRSFIMVLAVTLLGADPRTGTGLSLSIDFLLLLITAFCTFGVARYPFRQMLHLTTVRWVFVFLAFSGCSFAWTGTASLPNAIAYWSAMAADVAIVILLFRAAPLTETSTSLMTGYVWGACAVAAIAWIMPAQEDLRLGVEDLLGPNQIGYLCGFAFFFAQYLMRERKRGFVIPGVLLAVTLLRTLSKTTIVAFLVAEGFLLISDKSISRKSKVWVTLAATAVVAACWGLLASYYDIYTSAGSQSETLSGRLGIWAYFLAEAVQQPWIGHGFDSAWMVVPPFGYDNFQAAHAHNELLQQFYAYGAVGIFMFAGIYFSLYRHIRRLAKGPLRTFFFAFLLFVLVRGGADTERFDLSLPMWAIILLSILIEHRRANQAETAPVAVGNPFARAMHPRYPSYINEEITE
jgi:exopolysaccharide production protein ExoQ